MLTIQFSHIYYTTLMFLKGVDAKYSSELDDLCCLEESGGIFFRKQVAKILTIVLVIDGP